MRKVIIIIGVIIIALSFVSIILNTTNILATKQFTTTQTDVNSNFEQEQVLINSTMTKKISGIYSSVDIYVLLNPTAANQEFTITIGIRFPNNAYPACNVKANEYCQITSKTVTASSNNGFQKNLQIQENSIKIPLLTSGLNIPSSNYDRV